MDSATAPNKNWALYAGPAAAAAVGLALHLGAGLRPSACWTAVITTWCGLWWIFEPIPIPATSILPFALFPLVGVMDHKQTASGYGHSMIMLFIGGFMVAQALEKSGAHRRLAIGMVRAVGGQGGRRLVLGFMLASAFLSMWISNTATTLMLLPVALAVLEQTKDETERKRLAIPLMLSLAYAASIGGMGTPIGTPPNVIFKGLYYELVGKDVSFATWMIMAFPVIIIMFPIIWLWLTRKLGKAKAVELPDLGPWRTEERRVLIAFSLTALAWIFRKEPFGGWSALVNAPGVGDSTVALVAAMALFLWPNGHGERLLDWKTAKKIPWGLLLMVGAGMTIAKAFQVSGLSQAIGSSMKQIDVLPPLAMIAALAFVIGFMTNITSNTAMAALLMPLLAAVASAANMNPAMLMVPAVISTSCAFMLPVGTMPNAVVYGSGYLTIKDMVREGFVVNLAGAVVVTLVYWKLMPVFLKLLG